MVKCAKLLAITFLAVSVATPLDVIDIDHQITSRLESLEVLMKI